MNAHDIRVNQEIEEILTRKIEQALERAEAAEAQLAKATTIRANDLRRLSALLEALYSADFERQAMLMLMAANPLNAAIPEPVPERRIQAAARRIQARVERAAAKRARRAARRVAEGRSQ